MLSPLPQKAAEWKRCRPQALREGGRGGFSATAYFFGKRLHQELGVPIGLIHASWGGTVAEAWTSAPALKDFPECAAEPAQAAAIAAWADKPLVVRAGEISDNDTTWLNSMVIGRTKRFGVPRRYPVKPGVAKTYHKKEVIGSGPWFRAIENEEEKLRIRFDHSDGGLRFKGNSECSFAIAGEDRKFVWAKAEIDGDTIIVSSLEVMKPVAVRYAWDSNPESCLYNGADLPAVPFRSDDWPGVTEGK